VSAIVLDPGYSTTRAGFAGEDAPKSLIPTYYGKYNADGQEKLVYGDNIFVSPRPGLSIHNPIGRDGIVEDWDMAEKVWEHSFVSRLTGTKAGNPFQNGLNDVDDLPTEMDVESEEKPLSDSPLLMSEPGWNPARAREKTIEIAMEKWDTPAFYLARTGVLSAYVYQVHNHDMFISANLQPRIVSLPASLLLLSLTLELRTSPSHLFTMA
jgi:actin-related protein 4